MSADEDRSEPDVSRLFAPIAVEETFGGILSEAREVLGQLDDPVDAELWVSDLIGALASSAVGQASLMDRLTGSLVPAAEAASTPEALALLRAFAAVGSPDLRAAAGQAADRVARMTWPTRPGPERSASPSSLIAGTTPTSAAARSHSR